MRRTGRAGWFLAALGLLLALTIWGGTRLSVAYRSPLTCCAVDAGTGGGLAVARWAELMGYDVVLLRDPLWESADAFASPVGNCIITAGDSDWSPWGREFGNAEMQRVSNWIESGNTLIAITGWPEALPPPLLTLFDQPVEEEDEYDFDLTRALETSLETEEVIADDGSTLVVRASDTRWSDVPEEWQLASDETGSVLLRRPLGDGAIYLLLDDFAWVNHGLDVGDNAKTLAGILDREVVGGSIGFDEYRHGHGRVESLMTYALTLPGAASFVWISLLLIGLYVYGRNRRFGTPEPFEEPERRTAVEYIDSMAYLYQRARAAPLAVRAVVHRLRFLEQHRGRSDDELHRMIQTAEQEAAGDERPKNPSHLVRLTSKLIRRGRDVYGS